MKSKTYKIIGQIAGTGLIVSCLIFMCWPESDAISQLKWILCADAVLAIIHLGSWICIYKEECNKQQNKIWRIAECASQIWFYVVLAGAFYFWASRCSHVELGNKFYGFSIAAPLIWIFIVSVKERTKKCEAE